MDFILLQISGIENIQYFMIKRHDVIILNEFVHLSIQHRHKLLLLV